MSALDQLPLLMPQLDPSGVSLARSVAPNFAAESGLRQTRAGRRLLEATAEFEAMLICSWWQEAEKGIRDPFQGSMSAGLDGLKNVAMKALATKTALTGGIGISRMLFHALEPALKRKLAHEAPAPEAEEAARENSIRTLNPVNTGGYGR